MYIIDSDYQTAHNVCYLAASIVAITKSTRPQVLEISGMINNTFEWPLVTSFINEQSQCNASELLLPSTHSPLSLLVTAGETLDSLDQLLVIHIHDVVASCTRGKCAQCDNHMMKYCTAKRNATNAKIELKSIFAF